MYGYFLMTILVLVFIYKTICNPYCAMRCDNIENGYCDFFDKGLNERETIKHAEIWNQTEESRLNILDYVNSGRGLVASGWNNCVEEVANMHYVNYDYELEYLAEMKVRYLENIHINFTCLRSSKYYLNYLSCHKVYKQTNKVLVDVQTLTEWHLQKWMHLLEKGQSKCTMYEYRQLLAYHPLVDHIGCAVLRYPAKRFTHIQIHILCLFGSKDRQLQPLKVPDWMDATKHGRVCTKCRHGSKKCQVYNDTPTLCGHVESLRTDVAKRWNHEYWFSRDLSQNAERRKCFLKPLSIVFFILYFRIWII